MTTEEQGKLRALADLLITTLEDMPAEKADNIVATVAKEIYTELLGIKGRVRTRRTFAGCILYKDGGKTLWDVEAEFIPEPYFEEDK